MLNSTGMSHSSPGASNYRLESIMPLIHARTATVLRYARLPRASAGMQAMASWAACLLLVKSNPLLGNYKLRRLDDYCGRQTRNIAAAIKVIPGSVLVGLTGAHS